MGKLVVIVGSSGVGKTTLAHALAQAYPFQTAYEQHLERPFQSLFKQDKRYALANQMDYLLYRAEQERVLRASPQIGLVDGGLDLDFHGFTRLFYARGLLSDAEFDLCRRFYTFLRGPAITDFTTLHPPLRAGLLLPPDLIIALSASEETVQQRLAHRNRINIASSEDAGLMAQFIEEWLHSIPQEKIIWLDVSNEDVDYSRSTSLLFARLGL